MFAFFWGRMWKNPILAFSVFLPVFPEFHKCGLITRPWACLPYSVNWPSFELELLRCGHELGIRGHSRVMDGWRFDSLLCCCLAVSPDPWFSRRRGCVRRLHVYQCLSGYWVRGACVIWEYAVLYFLIWNMKKRFCNEWRRIQHDVIIAGYHRMGSTQTTVSGRCVFMPYLVSAGHQGLVLHNEVHTLI